MRRSTHMLGIAAALLAASAFASPAHAGKADNTLRVASRVVVPNVDPYYNVSGGVGISIADAIWDTLIYRDPETGAYSGDLATSWHQTDARTVELDLRRGVKFHNGADFDADDVVYTLNFVSNPTSKAFSPFAGWIDRAEKIDQYKVRVVAKQPLPTAIANLARRQLVIHPHDYYAKVGPKGMNAHPVGTGPYRAVEHALGKHLRLERNPNYFKGGPKAPAKIDRIELRYIPDAQTRVAEVVAGGLDLIGAVDRDQAAELRDVRNLQIISGESLNYSVLRMNTLPSATVRQLQDIRVRQAIMHAIDRETMAKFLIGEDVRVIHTECHPIEFGCTDEGAPRYAYDPVKARRLLADAGYPNGFSLDIYAYRDRNEVAAIIGYLAAVGIRARLRFVETTTAQVARRSGRMPMMTANWGSYIYDASGSVSLYHEFSTDDMNRDPEIRDLLLQADSVMNPDTRKTAYARALRLIAERAYVLPLYSLPTYFVAGKDLAFKTTPEELMRFYEMSWK